MQLRTKFRPTEYHQRRHIHWSKRAQNQKRRQVEWSRWHPHFIYLTICLHWQPAPEVPHIHQTVQKPSEDISDAFTRQSRHQSGDILLARTGESLEVSPPDQMFTLPNLKDSLLFAQCAGLSPDRYSGPPAWCELIGFFPRIDWIFPTAT